MRKKKRTLSPEQIAKMQAGRAAAAQRRANEKKTQERVAAMSDLDARLRAAAAGERSGKVSIRKRGHRRRGY